MKYRVVELTWIVHNASGLSTLVDGYWNTIGLFPSVAVAKAYAEACTYSSSGKTPLFWLDNTKGKTGRGWVAYKNADYSGQASWQIQVVEFEVDESLLDAGEGIRE